MKKENLFKLLNKGKRLNHFEPVKPKKYTLKSIVYKYTGLKVLKAFESLLEGLKEDLTIIFKPTQRFTKKDLKGVDVMSLNAKHQEMQDEIRGTHTLHASNKEVQASKSNDTTLKESAGHKEVPANDEFINWFDVKSQESTLQNTKCTYTDKYGNKVSLDESYEALQRESD